jgi:CRISPR type IV-associated protein Csf2
VKTNGIKKDRETKISLDDLLPDLKLVSLSGKIRLLTGATFSYADLKEQTMTLLPLMLGSVYLPEGLIRGRWRHLCVVMIKEALLARGIKLTLADLYWLYIGGVKDAGAMQYDVLADLPILRAHVFSSLWGCSEPMFQERKVQVEDARPDTVVEPEIIYGQRTDPVQRGEVQKTDLDNPKSFDDYLDRLESIRTGRKAAQQAEKDRKSGVAPANNNADPANTADPVPQPANMPHSRQIMPPNLELDHNIDIIRPTALQLGMFLATLRKWSENPYFGARVGRNMGLVDVAYDVAVDGRSLGTLKVHGRKREIEMPEALARYEALFWDQFDSLDFRRPVMRERAVAPAPSEPAAKAKRVAAVKVNPAPVKRAAVKSLVKRAKSATRRRHAG